MFRIRRPRSVQRLRGNRGGNRDIHGQRRADEQRRDPDELDHRRGNHVRFHRVFRDHRRRDRDWFQHEYGYGDGDEHDYEHDYDYGRGGTTTGGTTTGGTTGGGAGGAAASTTDGTTTTGSSGGQCPDDATFCSGFEENALPEGAVYKLNGDPATPWTSDFEVDTTVFNTAPSALRVRPNTEGSGAYKMLAVPTPGAAFWVRFYIRSDVDLGHTDHNVFASAAGSDNPNDSTYVEFAEDVGIAFNSHDVVRWPEGFGRLQDGGTNPFTLPKDEWHCIEISYDGQARVQQLYVEDALQIDAQAYPEGANAFTTFKFGYNSLHGTTRNTWYDDVAVAPGRIGCF